MQRGRFIAGLVAVVALGGLVFARINAGDDTRSAAPTEAADSSQDADADAAGSTADDGTAADGAGEGAATDEAGGGATTSTSTTVDAADAPDNLGHAGTLTDIDGWLQTDATSFEDFDGAVRIVQFWTFACYNCKNTIPHLQGIYERWQPEGLEIIGVHAPEFDFERDPDAVASAAVDHGVIWPIALDTEKRNFRSWQPGRRFWPRTFVVDQNGDIRFDHIGEGSYDELEATVAYLIENGP